MTHGSSPMTSRDEFLRRLLKFPVAPIPEWASRDLELGEMGPYRPVCLYQAGPGQIVCGEPGVVFVRDRWRKTDSEAYRIAMDHGGTYVWCARHDPWAASGKPAD